VVDEKYMEYMKWNTKIDVFCIRKNLDKSLHGSKKDIKSYLSMW